MRPLSDGSMTQGKHLHKQNTQFIASKLKLKPQNLTSNTSMLSPRTRKQTKKTATYKTTRPKNKQNPTTYPSPPMRETHQKSAPLPIPIYLFLPSLHRKNSESDIRLSPARKSEIS
jgi:hypothetical protein